MKSVEVDRQTVAQMTASQVHEKLMRALEGDRLTAHASHDLDYAQDLMEALDEELAEYREGRIDSERLWGAIPMVAALRLPIPVEGMEPLFNALRIIYGESVRIESKGAFLLAFQQSNLDPERLATVTAERMHAVVDPTKIVRAPEGDSDS